MKKSVIAALALSLMLCASVAGANVIGVFGDVEGTNCNIGLGGTYVTVPLHLLVFLSDLPAISACEFKVEGINTGGPDIVTPVWNTDLVIGNFEEGVALAFNPLLEGPVGYLGRIEIFLFGPYPENHAICIAPSDAGNLLVVDATGGEYQAQGWCSLANCTLPACDCESVPTDESSFSEVKALY